MIEVAAILERVARERKRLSALVADGTVYRTSTGGGGRDPKCAGQGRGNNKSSGRGERPGLDKANEAFFHGGRGMFV